MKQGEQSGKGVNRRRSEKGQGRKMLGEANLGLPNFSADVAGGVADLMGGNATAANPWQQGCASNGVVEQSSDPAHSRPMRPATFGL